MPVDHERIDAAVLALLFLTSFPEDSVQRAWKSHDWEALDRLFIAGFIREPKSTARSVVLTSEGAERARALFEQLISSEAPLELPFPSACRGGSGKMPEDVRLRVAYLLDRFCTRLTKDASSKLTFFYRFRGSSAILHEVGPAWRGQEPIERPFARLRYDGTSDVWGLDWRRANERWEPYVDFERGRGAANLLRVIHEDPDAVFFG